MGLANLLLDTDAAVARLQGGGGTSAAVTSPMVDAGVAADAAAAPEAASAPASPGISGEDATKASFVILWPALGCPQLVHPSERFIDIIFLSKEQEGQVNKDLATRFLQEVFVLDWTEARRPYNEDRKGWQPSVMSKGTLASKADLSSVAVRTVLSLDKYEQLAGDKPLQFGELYHTIDKVVVGAYKHQKRGFKSIVSMHVKLQPNIDLQEGQLYTLYYAPENGVLRVLLQDRELLKKPYSDVPVMQDQGGDFIGGHHLIYRWHHNPQQSSDPAKATYGDRRRANLVRLFHPFMIGRTYQDGNQKKPREYLNVGHLTDLHTSSLWDFFDQRIYPKYSVDQATLSYKKDKNGYLQGRTPRDRNTLFAATAERYNNPNLNVRNLTHQLNQRAQGGKVDDFVDLILQTGDLVDFNRGFNLNPRHDPDKDYVFNLSWLRFYELLLLDYERPTYTSLGNHDWRLNPYPPRIGPQRVHILLFFYLALMLVAVGAACGSAVGPTLAAMDAGSDTEAVGYFFLLMLLLPFIAAPVLLVFVLLLGGFGLGLDETFDILVEKTGLAIIFGGGWLIGFLTVVLIVIHNVTRSDSNKIHDAGEGALSGMIMGSILGTIVLIVGIVLIFKRVDYMGHITNLFAEDFKSLLDEKNVAYLNAFGNDGVLKMSERAIDWYSLVINPFKDYAFSYGNMLFMLGSWHESEILASGTPVSDDTLSDRQVKLLRGWIQQAVIRREALRHQGFSADQKQVVPILGLHTPVFCPVNDLNLDELNQKGAGTGDSSLARGIMEEHRNELIKRFFQLGQGRYPGTLQPIMPISLTGHTHTYDLFKHVSQQKVKWYQLGNFAAGFADQGLHITTACAGPPSDGVDPDDDKRTKRQHVKPLLRDFDAKNDNTYDDGPANAHGKRKADIYFKKGDRIIRPAGGRVLTFDAKTGRLEKIEEISAETAQWGDA